jgi:probable HAF family extracellular repeat protein
LKTSKIIGRLFQGALSLRFWVLVPVLAPTLALATTYTVTDLYALQTPTGYSSVNPTIGTAQPAANGQVVGYGTSSNTNLSHAFLWTGAGSPIDLNPSGFRDSEAAGVNDGQQVGFAQVDVTPFDTHAMLWSGTAGSAVDLNTPGFIYTQAYAVGGGQQVGVGGLSPSISHALLWSGTAASAVDLNPSGFTNTIAFGVGGGQQVGGGVNLMTNSGDALLWSGTAASVVDLNPVGFTGSLALAVNDEQQVGYGDNSATGTTDALLWSDTAASAVDLNPNGFSYSYAYGVGDGVQVGYGLRSTTPSGLHALLWSGSAASYVDLGALLPNSASWAYSVDASGNVFGLAEESDIFHAVEWSPVSVPEPAALATMGLGLLISSWRRCRRHELKLYASRA